MNDLIIDRPMAITLSPDHLALVLDSLAERPFKIANPVIQEIIKQIRQAAEPKETKTDERSNPGSQPSSVGNGHDRSDGSVGSGGVSSDAAGGEV